MPSLRGLKHQMLGCACLLEIVLVVGSVFGATSEPRITGEWLCRQGIVEIYENHTVTFTRITGSGSRWTAVLHIPPFNFDYLPTLTFCWGNFRAQVAQVGIHVLYEGSDPQV